MIGFPRIVFHGSSLPPGTDSTELRKPRFEQPLFVTDNLEMARWYMDYYYDEEHKSPSVFIFKLKESSKNLLFNMENYDDYKRLKSKFPNFISYLQYKLLDNDGTFYDAINTISSFMYYIWVIKNQNQFKRNFKLRNDTGKSTLLKINAAIELGIAELSDENGSKMVSCTKYVEDVLTGSASNKDALIRRYAKSEIYKEIYDMGFRIIKDGDTTTERRNGRNEYAILDMDVIESGLNKSMSLDIAKRKLKEIEKEFQNYGNEGVIW